MRWEELAGNRVSIVVVRGAGRGPTSNVQRPAPVAVSAQAPGREKSGSYTSMLRWQLRRLFCTSDEVGSHVDAWIQDLLKEKSVECGVRT